MINKLFLDMISYYQGDPKRIQHFIKVHEFGKIIALGENIDSNLLEIIELSCIVHDIGIKEAEKRNGSSAGHLQEKYGPSLVFDILKDYSLDQSIKERIAYLVGHHHTYNNIDNIDYQILVEADFLVNIYEDTVSKENTLNIRNNIFKTKTGISLINSMYL